MTRRKYLGLIAAGLFSRIRAGRASDASPRAHTFHSGPDIGAIRWDAWYDPGRGTVAKAVEDTLGPAKYHFRMPFFGKKLSPNQVRINGYSQAIIDQEIEYAVY